MKNYQNYIGLLIIALAVSACNSVGYSEQDEKVAKKYCSCYKDAAKQSVEIQDWYADHYMEIEDLIEEKMTAKKNGEEFDSDDKLITEGEEMLEDYDYAMRVAKTVCYEGYLNEKDYAPIRDDLKEAACHDVSYAVDNGLIATVKNVINMLSN